MWCRRPNLSVIACFRQLSASLALKSRKSYSFLVMNEPKNFWPADFPSELAEAAFWSSEPAWDPRVAAQVVEWLGLHLYAVLGTELWIIRDGLVNALSIGQSGMPEVHGNTVARWANEPWAAFVSRAASETVAYLRSFQSGDIVVRGKAHFNLTWVSEQEFEKLVSP